MSGKLNHTEKLWSLYEMEITVGEPDVVGYEKDKEEWAESYYADLDIAWCRNSRYPSFE